MHLWPSLKVRNSFKVAHLRRIERYNSDKKQQQQDEQQSLGSDSKPSASWDFRGFPFCRDLLLIFTCCFCFGIFSDGDDIDYIY